MPLVLVRERQPPIIEEANSGLSLEEVVAYCPVCKAFQTLWFTKGKLMQIRKFSQYGDKVYHDCGADKPCRLYRTF